MGAQAAVAAADRPARTPNDIVDAWRRGVRSLDPDTIPAPGLIWFEPGAGGRPGVWSRVHAAMLAFLDEWGVAAVHHNWRTIDLFGVHRLAGAIRGDSNGALIMVYPGRVVAMTDMAITIERQFRSTYTRMTNPADSIPLWTFARTARA